VFKDEDAFESHRQTVGVKWDAMRYNLTDA